MATYVELHAPDQVQHSADLGYANYSAAATVARVPSTTHFAIQADIVHPAQDTTVMCTGMQLTRAMSAKLC